MVANRLQGKHWDIFCRVVDNFGDVGVCWRLARQLATEHGQAVRLWVDDLDIFARLCPEFDARLGRTPQGVTVRRWATPLENFGTAADIVIEAFACELPEAYLAAMATMAARGAPPAWINLEYLSAETWIAGCHTLGSPHPRLPLRKHFFFPGFVADSGGLLREAGLMAQHRAWQADRADNRMHFGLPPTAADKNEILVSLFCYDNPRLPALLDAWASGATPLRCLVPEGLALRQVANWLTRPGLHPGETVQRGALTLHALPFSSQMEYDRLLSLCDLNLVRGEDSFIRAQWAGRPLVWHIYPQVEDAHHAKLAAFLDRYRNGLDPATATVCRTFWQAWNGIRSEADAAAAAWLAYRTHLPILTRQAAAWAEDLSQQPDLAGNLMLFCAKLI